MSNAFELPAECVIRTVGPRYMDGNRTKPYEIELEHAAGEGEPFWEFWIAGFEQAMHLRPQAWRSYLDADGTEVEAAFSVICGFLEMEL